MTGSLEALEHNGKAHHGHQLFSVVGFLQKGALQISLQVPLFSNPITEGKVVLQNFQTKCFVIRFL